MIFKFTSETQARIKKRIKARINTRLKQEFSKDIKRAIMNDHKKHFKVLVSILSLLALFSCASTSSEKENSRDPLALEFDDLTNEDFNTVQPYSFNRQRDSFKLQMDEADVLAAESIARAPEKMLERAQESTDPIAQIISLCYQKNFEQADKLLDQMFTKYKLFPSYWNQVGTCYFLKGNKRKAFLFYNKAIDLKKNYTPAYNNLGVVFMAEGKDQKALVAFKKAYNQGTFSLTPVLNLSQLYLKYGFYNKARPMIESLYKKNSSDVDVVHALSSIYLSQKNYTKSVSLLESLDSDLLEEKPQLGLNYALSLALAGKKSKAMSAYDDIRSIDSSKEKRLYEYSQKIGNYLRGIRK